MNRQKMENLKKRFSSYVATFRSADPEFMRNIDIKEYHTHKVCEAAIEIGRSMQLTEKELYLAEITALFHDIGRFPQYKKYKTFVDMHSENHALLGVKVLKEENIFDELEAQEKDLILKAISYHNRLVLPQDEDGKVLLFTKLLRDADKIDIFRVVTEYYEGLAKTGERNEAIELGLPDTLLISEDAIASVLEHKIVRAEYLKSLNDFKLLQISWIFDINFHATIKIIDEKKYLKKIGESLPDFEQKDVMFLNIRKYITERLNGRDL